MIPIDDIQRGIANRGLGHRGSSTHASASRPALAGTSAAGSPGLPASVPPSAPRVGAPKGGAKWNPDALFPPGSALEKRAEQLLARQQSLAESLMTELLPLFKSSFSKRRRPFNQRLGTPVPIKVIAFAEFSRRNFEEMRFQEEQDMRALLRYRADFVQEQIDDAANRGLLEKNYGRVDANTVFTDNDRAFVRARVSTPPTRPAAGFYSEQDRTLHILAGQVGIEVVAHELCHAYASHEWNETQLHLSTFDFFEKVNILDEAVTSELASLVLFDWHSNRSTRTTSTRRFSRDAPSGYVGYGSKFKTQGAKFLGAVEGGGTPGFTTMSAYFGGNVRVKINKREPIDSFIELGTKRFKLSELFTS